MFRPRAFGPSPRARLTENSYLYCFLEDPELLSIVYRASLTTESDV